MIIGITGPARHGKDTVGQMMHELLPDHRHFAFATALKELVHTSFVASKEPEEAKEDLQTFTTTPWCILDGLSELHGVLAQRYDLDVGTAMLRLMDVLRETHEILEETPSGVLVFESSWRKLYQVVGTEWGRQTIDNRIWVDYLPPENVIVTDVRAYGDSEDRDLEAEAILDIGGMIVQVINPRKVDCVREHPSEAGVASELISTTIYNTGTLDELRTKVHNLIKGRMSCQNQ